MASESGAMTILTLFLIMIVFVAAGFAVDVMRYDRERAKLQYALDRAVLAAADLDQDLCPKDVVKDYLKKEGLDQYLVGEPIVEPETCGSQAVVLEGYRRVEASAKMDIEMHFMKWRGVETIASVASSVAEESIGNVEISLVLDVSGSMRGTKLTNLKKAANNFIDEMINKSEDGKLSISIVPYSEQVAIPSYLMDLLKTEGENDIANCIDFNSGDFTTTTFDNFDAKDPNSGQVVRVGTPIPKTLHFTDSGNADYRPSNGVVTSYTCLPNTATSHREITIMQKDAQKLKDEIALLQADGWTSIDVGLKWGLTLLDESFRYLTNEMSKVGHIPTEFKARPAPNKSADTLKVVVLMTDGANTKQHLVLPPYHQGTSDVWWNASDDIYSFYDRDQSNYIWPDVEMTEYNSSRGWYWARDERQDHAYGEGNRKYMQYQCTSYSNGTCYSMNRSRSREKSEGTDVVELSWPDLWKRTTKYRIYQMLYDAYGSSYAYDWYYAASDELDQPDKDPRVRSLCDKAKEEKVITFSIAFDAPTAAKNLLKYCISDDGAYYEASNEDIVDVFASIGSTIQNLRLTQ